MSEYSIGQLAKLAGVSVRTLRYYDEIELLRPSDRTRAGYRQYHREDLLRLQQILFYRELGLPLDEIRRILDDPDFDPLQSLREHQSQLLQRQERVHHLLKNVNRTIHRLEEDDMTLTDEQLFEGFTQEQIERYGQEARDRWGDEVDAVENRLRHLSPERWELIKAEGRQVSKDIAALMDHEPEDPIVQEAVSRHHRWIEHFYEAPAERYLGLSRMYIDHPEFKAFYDQIEPGLAEFLSEAMAIYAREKLT